MSNDARKARWMYFDHETNQWMGPVTIQELDALHQQEKLHDFDTCASLEMLRTAGPMGPQGVPYSMISRLDIDFAPTVEDFYAGRAGRPVTVFSGANNCGKTLLLRQIWELVGQGGYLIACNRFSHVDQLNSRKTEPYEHRRYYDNFIRQNSTSQQNLEANELQLEQIITGLRNPQREKLFEVCERLIGNKFSLKRIDTENDFSPFYVDMDGENLRYGSTGTRLLMTLLGVLLDDRFSVVLIDEPELSLSPRIQAALARFMYNPDERRQFFPHLRQLFVATHSHLFLDRSVFSNNFSVTKSGSQISIAAIQSVADLHHLQFNLLGNELESMFLPSAIVMVEGVSDVSFVTKVVGLHTPLQRKVAVVGIGGEGRTLERLSFLKEAFGDDLAISPYRDRIFVVLDKKRSVTVDRIVGQGVQRENILILEMNGIEYYYPRDLLANIFHCPIEELKQIDLENDPIKYNGIRLSKKDLAQRVADNTTATHTIAPELEGLVSRINAICR